MLKTKSEMEGVDRKYQWKFLAELHMGEFGDIEIGHNLWIIGTVEWHSEGTENIFSKILEENFPTLEKEMPKRYIRPTAHCGDTEVLCSQISIRGTRNAKHTGLSLQRERCISINFSSPKSLRAVWWSLWCAAKTTSDSPQALLLSLSISRTYLYERCHMFFKRVLM